MAKMDKKWVLLCSTAIAGVYAAGFFSTETQATQVESQPHAPIAIQTKVEKSSVVSLKSNEPKRIYKEGTFTGTGENRRGYIQVAVTIKKDKITDVEISDFGMHYSEDDVIGLPDEVVKQQSAQVSNVSGATYSTQAFEDAVQEALSQAHNA
ncbi:MAG: FMN-binding protein [Bacillota bacterium]|nr:FMN-binding protein [Bacillota bacterium]